MNDTKKFYITTTLPYVNADPHIGFALELVQADALARYYRDILGQEVFFNTGTDEHGQKIYQKAKQEGRDPQAYCDEYAAKFRQLIPALGVLEDIRFIRTTDPHHIRAAQEFWKLCDKNGYIEKKFYKIKYCVGCELEKTESELVDGRCPLHPNLELELREEENYFFKFSALQDKLLKFYDDNPDFVVPNFRFNEIKQFVKAGLQDFSISRLKEKMPWGVEVPGDSGHVMYVWFDALVNYISTLGWPDDQGLFEKFWPGVQVAGKDNLRQQSAMWQAMLMAAGLPNSRQVIIHGFITSGGQKMSKSLGNVANPYEILDKLQQSGLTKEQATDALRYYLLREIPTFEDGDYTWEHFKETYNANLANGLGNLTSRILKMAVTYEVKINPNVLSFEKIKDEPSTQDYLNSLNNYNLQKATQTIWNRISMMDAFIQANEPFKKIKTDPEKAKSDLLLLLNDLVRIYFWLKPFLPQTSGKIWAALKDPKLENIPRLFPRIE